MRQQIGSLVGFVRLDFVRYQKLFINSLNLISLVLPLYHSV